MKQKPNLLLLLFFFIECSTHAQVNFKLSDYKYRTSGFKALSAYGNSTGNLTTGNSSTHNFTLFPAMAYLNQYSTNEREFRLSFNPSLSFAHSGSKVNIPGGGPIPGINTSNSSTSFSAGGSLSALTRDFKSNFFIEYGGDVSIHAGSSSGKQPPAGKSTSSGLGFMIAPTVGIGRGRLEYVSDAQMAMFILNDLVSAGKIQKEVAPETVNAFAQLITRIYNQRVFDFRKRRMYEMEKIDSFLRATKLVTSCDVTTYNIIADNWAFAIQPTAIDATHDISGSLIIVDASNKLSDREGLNGRFGQMARYSGTQYYVRFTPSFMDSSSRLKTDTSNMKQPYHNYRGDITIGVDQETPLNLKWQTNRFASLNFNYGRYTQISGGTENSYNGSAVSLYAGMGLGYYPNTRTVVQATGSIAVSKGLALGKSTSSPVVISPSILVNANYFLTYMSRFSGNVNISYISSAGSGAKGNFSFSYFIRYTHYIF